MNNGSSNPEVTESPLSTETKIKEVKNLFKKSEDIKNMLLSAAKSNNPRVMDISSLWDEYGIEINGSYNGRFGDEALSRILTGEIKYVSVWYGEYNNSAAAKLPKINVEGQPTVFIDLGYDSDAFYKDERLGHGPCYQVSFLTPLVKDGINTGAGVFYSLNFTNNGSFAKSKTFDYAESTVEPEDQEPDSKSDRLNANDLETAGLALHVMQTYIDEVLNPKDI